MQKSNVLNSKEFTNDIKKNDSFNLNTDSSNKNILLSSINTNNDNYFLTNNLNDDVYEKPISITFEREIDKEKEKKKKKFLYDLNEKQKQEAENLKIEKIIQNEIYLKKNKILKYIIQIFLSDLLKEKPEDIYNFASEYFTKNDFKQYIMQKLKEILNK